MKNLNKILFVGAIAVSLGVANRANAQFKPIEDDGIAASPRVRQQIEERKAMERASRMAESFVVTHPRANDEIAASPTGKVGYKIVREDGISASPKVQQQLDEHQKQFMGGSVK